MDDRVFQAGVCIILKAHEAVVDSVSSYTVSCVIFVDREAALMAVTITVRNPDPITFCLYWRADTLVRMGFHSVDHVVICLNPPICYLCKHSHREMDYKEGEEIGDGLKYRDVAIKGPLAIELQYIISWSLKGYGIDPSCYMWSCGGLEDYGAPSL